MLTAIEAAGDILYDWDLATDSVQWAGAAGGLFGEAPAGNAVQAKADEATERPLIVRQLLDYSRRGPMQMGKAITSLARIGRRALS